MLEVFNTLLRQLRLSVDYELTGSYDGSVNIGTKIIKAHEERQLQEAVIRTIGESVGSVSVWEALQDRLLGCLWCFSLSHMCLYMITCVSFVHASIFSPLAPNSPSCSPLFLSHFLSGSFANTLPTYQRSEVMLFIMGKIPVPGVHPALPSSGSG